MVGSFITVLMAVSCPVWLGVLWLVPMSISANATQQCKREKHFLLYLALVPLADSYRCQFISVWHIASLFSPYSALPFHSQLPIGWTNIEVHLSIKPQSWTSTGFNHSCQPLFIFLKFIDLTIPIAYWPIQPYDMHFLKRLVDRFSLLDHWLNPIQPPPTYNSISYVTACVCLWHHKACTMGCMRLSQWCVSEILTQWDTERESEVAFASMMQQGTISLKSCLCVCILSHSWCSMFLLKGHRFSFWWFHACMYRFCPALPLLSLTLHSNVILSSVPTCYSSPVVYWMQQCVREECVFL